ncbi:MAG: tyrosine-type recombinase/integrase [Bradyrhizobium sp.]
MRVNLTDVLVRAAEPPATGALTIWDINLKHFGLRVSSGGSKTFILLLGSGRRHAIGRFEPKVFGLGQARDKARQILAEHVLGRYQPQTITWEQARDEFLDHAERENRCRTYREYKRALTKYFPFVAKRLADVTKTDIAKKLDKLNHAPSMRSRTLTYCKIFFNWCVDRGYLNYNPITASAGKVKKRSRVLSPEELVKIWRACEEVIEIGGEATLDMALANVPRVPVAFARIVQLLILTGMRRTECSLLARTCFSHNEQTVVLPPEITKNGRELLLPLGPLAVELVSANLSIDGVIFAGRRHGKPFSGWSKAKARLDEACGVSRWTLHDLRRTYRTTLSKLKVAPHIAEMLLNHASARTALEETYDVYAYLDEKREAVLRYEEYMKKVLEL